MFKVGDRVNRTRRGCMPLYGTVVLVLAKDEEDNSQWYSVDWDHIGVTTANSREIKLVQVDRSWKAMHGRRA